jgi:hypothetical protein
MKHCCTTLANMAYSSNTAVNHNMLVWLVKQVQCNAGLQMRLLRAIQPMADKIYHDQSCSADEVEGFWRRVKSREFSYQLEAGP